jgi:hypothetical protein
MGFIRRLLGAGTRPEPLGGATVDPVAPSDADAEERAYELELLRSEQDRLDDLAQRQLRFAQYASQPPAQGGERRADDHDGPAGGR